MVFESLLGIELALEDSLIAGEICEEEYDAETSDVLLAAGWTHDEYELEIDRRWDHLDIIKLKEGRPSS